MSTETKPNAVTIAQPAAVAMPVWTSGMAGALPEALATGKIILESGFAPPSYKSPQAVVVGCAMGARLGLDMFSSLAGIAVVNNRPTLYGDAMLAVCMSHPAFEDISEKVDGTGDAMAATVTIKRAKRSPYTSTFSVGDAKVAGLWGKQGPWAQQPKRMLTMRARSFALRGAFADALAGFHSREEMEDSDPIDVTSTAYVHPATPEPARTATTTDATPTSTATQEADTAKTAQTSAPASTAAAATLHPARAAARELYRNLGSAGKGIIARVSALYGAPDAKSVPDDRLEAFGKDIAELSKHMTNLPALEEKLGLWENWENEAKKEAAEAAALNGGAP